jgi:hypothetical protein
MADLISLRLSVWIARSDHQDNDGDEPVHSTEVKPHATFSLRNTYQRLGWENSAAYAPFKSTLPPVKDDEIIADDDARVAFEIERVATDGKTGKPVADITRYTYRDDDARYVVTFERQKTILQAIFTERAPFIKRLIAKIVGFDGAYRFTGKVTIEKLAKDVRVEIFDDHAIWELMYFGKARPPGESFAKEKSASAA